MIPPAHYVGVVGPIVAVPPIGCCAAAWRTACPVSPTAGVVHPDGDVYLDLKTLLRELPLRATRGRQAESAT